MKYILKQQSVKLLATIHCYIDYAGLFSNGPAVLFEDFQGVIRQMNMEQWKNQFHLNTDGTYSPNSPNSSYPSLVYLLVQNYMMIAPITVTIGIPPCIHQIPAQSVLFEYGSTSTILPITEFNSLYEKEK